MKILLVFLLIWLFPLNVCAHKPIDTSNSATRNDPIEIKNHEISWVAYNKLTDLKDVDYYLLSSVKKGEKIYASILVPKIDRLKDFEPVVAIIGPELNIEMGGLKKETVRDLLEIKHGEGIIIKKNNKENETFFEPFTQTAYWKRQELEVQAPADGTYYLTVFDIKNRADKYVLSIGKQEKWGIRDLAKMPTIWWSVRMFVEKEKSTYIITGIIILVFLLLIYLIIKHLRT